MKDIVVLETMEDIDKNSDGKVSLEEYVGMNDIWEDLLFFFFLFFCLVVSNLIENCYFESSSDYNY